MTTRIFVTKYALTTGVYEAEAEIDEGGGYASVRNGAYRYGLSADEYTTTFDQAKKRITAMLEAKQRSLRKQQSKLDAIAANLAAGKLPRKGEKP